MWTNARVWTHLVLCVLAPAPLNYNLRTKCHPCSPRAFKLFCDLFLTACFAGQFELYEQSRILCVPLPGGVQR